MWKVLEKKWKEYENLFARGEIYGAFLRLAAISASLDGLEPGLRAEFKKRCENAPLSSRMLDSITTGIQTDRQRIRRILSIGKTWTGEELVLVITMKVEIDSATSFLEDRGFEVPEEIPDSVALIIQRVATSKRNRRAFDNARLLVRTNWGLAIKHPLLTDEKGKGKGVSPEWPLDKP